MRRPALAVIALIVGLATLCCGQAAAKTAKHAKAKTPVVTKVSPLRLVVGQQLTLVGRHFRAGKGRNGVGFKADGQPIVFVRSGLSTRRIIRLTLPAKLNSVLGGTSRRVRLRVLTSRFGARYTSRRLSPIITPTARGSVSAPTLPGGATGTGLPVRNCNVNANDGGDNDGDRLSNALEHAIATDPCNADSDGDGVEDGYEYRSAIDLNDDDYQQPDTVLPYPGRRPYPNPLDASDAGTDFDGDGLTLKVEYGFWLASTPAAARTFADALPAATPLSYSDGLQYSVSAHCPTTSSTLCGAGDDGRRVPTLSRAAAQGTFQTFWAGLRADYRSARLSTASVFASHAARTVYDLRDVNLSGGVSTREQYPDDVDGNLYLSDDERDVDGDGLTNYDETVGRAQRGYWSACYATETAYPVAYGGTDPLDPDSDGDGVPDAADDQDHDDVPNLMELSRIRASSPAADDRKANRDCVPADGLPDDNHAGSYGFVNPFNPCLPYADSRTCPRVFPVGATFAPLAGPIWWALQ